MELPKGSTRASRVVFGAFAKDMRRKGFDADFGNDSAPFRFLSEKDPPEGRRLPVRRGVEL